MRRKEREINDFGEKIEILQNGNFLSLALLGEGVPYVVPMNYGFVVNGERITIYLHSAPTGKKLDLIKANPKVAFTICGYEKIIEHEKAEHWTSHYRSLIGAGTAYLSQSEEEKRGGLDAIMTHCNYKGRAEYSQETLKALVVIKIEVETLTGKENK